MDWKNLQGIDNARSGGTTTQWQCLDQSAQPVPLFPEMWLSYARQSSGPLARCSSHAETTCSRTLGTDEHLIGLSGKLISIRGVATGHCELTQDVDEFREIHPPLAVPGVQIGPCLDFDAADESNQNGHQIVEAASADLRQQTNE